eukprot:568429-Prorocentrum_minimum.AAC.1
MTSSGSCPIPSSRPAGTRRSSRRCGAIRHRRRAIHPQQRWIHRCGRSCWWRCAQSEAGRSCWSITV